MKTRRLMSLIKLVSNDTTGAFNQYFILLYFSSSLIGATKDLGAFFFIGYNLEHWLLHVHWTILFFSGRGTTRSSG